MTSKLNLLISHKSSQPKQMQLLQPQGDTKNNQSFESRSSISPQSIKTLKPVLGPNMQTKIKIQKLIFKTIEDEHNTSLLDSSHDHTPKPHSQNNKLPRTQTLQLPHEPYITPRLPTTKTITFQRDNQRIPSTESRLEQSRRPQPQEDNVSKHSQKPSILFRNSTVKSSVIEYLAEVEERKEEALRSLLKVSNNSRSYLSNRPSVLTVTSLLTNPKIQKISKNCVKPSQSSGFVYKFRFFVEEPAWKPLLVIEDHDDKTKDTDFN